MSERAIAVIQSDPKDETAEIAVITRQMVSHSNKKIVCKTPIVGLTVVDVTVFQGQIISVDYPVANFS